MPWSVASAKFALQNCWMTMFAISSVKTTVAQLCDFSAQHRKPTLLYFQNICSIWVMYFCSLLSKNRSKTFYLAVNLLRYTSGAIFAIKSPYMYRNTASSSLFWASIVFLGSRTWILNRRRSAQTGHLKRLNSFPICFRLGSNELHKSGSIKTALGRNGKKSLFQVY
jgi:hypothetical protein